MLGAEGLRDNWESARVSRSHLLLTISRHSTGNPLTTLLVALSSVLPLLKMVTYGVGEKLDSVNLESRIRDQLSSLRKSKLNRIKVPTLSNALLVLAMLQPSLTRVLFSPGVSMFMGNLALGISRPDTPLR